jgi:hypothetical protein
MREDSLPPVLREETPMNPLRKVVCGLALVILAAGVAVADVTTKGQVEGTVTAEGNVLPGVTVTLSGAGLMQGSVVATTDGNGHYRFPNINPGSYTLRMELSGFAPREHRVDIRVGRTSTIDGQLALSTMSETVTVVADAPLFDQTTAAHGTNLDLEQLESLPTSRDFSDIVNSAAGFDNQAAYGAGGNVAGYDYFGYGAATNSYQLNGVNVTNLEFGNSWVRPNYDTIQEVQIVGPGGSAEYSNYSGAVVNVVTKSGTNELQGTVSGYFRNDALTGDNSKGIKDLEHGTLDYDRELSLTAGGPLIREKLNFFGSLGYLTSSTAPPGTSFYDDHLRKQYQFRLDYLPSVRHNVTGMINHEPIELLDLGLQAETGPEVGYAREQETTTNYLSWLGQWSDDTLTEVRYAGVQGSLGRIANEPDLPGVTDASTGVQYNSTGIQRVQENDRDEVRAVATHYVDDFLSGDHELKAGIEYEDAWQATESAATGGGQMFFMVPLGPVTYVQALTGYIVDQQATLERTGLFVQDRATFGPATVSVGLRYDAPRTSDANTGKELLSFNQFAPRLGLAYDLGRNGRSIIRAGAGRYYDKVPTYGPATYAGTGLGLVTYYGFLSTEPLDPTNVELLRQLVFRPENITTTFSSTSIPVEDGIQGPHVDVLNLGFDQELGQKWALSFNYIHRETKDFIVLTLFSDGETFEPVQVTHPFNGRTFTHWRKTGGGPRKEALGNRDFFDQTADMVILELRGRPTQKLTVDSSFTVERSRGTRDNNECGVLGLCSNGVDANPNFVENPFYTEGSLSQERPWHFKTRGVYELPLGFEAGWDFRWFAGRRYGATDYCFNIPECNDPNQFTVLIEPRDARKEDASALLNLRFAYNFSLGPTRGTVSVDALNVTNEPIDFNTNIQNNINSVYGRESAEQGSIVSAFGQPYEVSDPRQFRLGIRFAF